MIKSGLGREDSRPILDPNAYGLIEPPVTIGFISSIPMSSESFFLFYEEVMLFTMLKLLVIRFPWWWWWKMSCYPLSMIVARGGENSGEAGNFGIGPDAPVVVLGSYPIFLLLSWELSYSPSFSPFNSSYGVRIWFEINGSLGGSWRSLLFLITLLFILLDGALLLFVGLTLVGPDLVWIDHTREESQGGCVNHGSLYACWAVGRSSASTWNTFCKMPMEVLVRCSW